MNEDIIFDQSLKPEPIPEVVYHYTTIDTLMAILKSGQIWSTSIDYLNDVSEQHYVIGRIRDRIPLFANRKDLPAPDIFSKLLATNLATEHFEAHPFIVSFCGQEDSLDHWRSYCPDGNGVSIGFKTECLKRTFIGGKKAEVSTEEPGSPLTTFLTKVKYINEKDIDVIDKMIEFAIVAAGALSKMPSFSVKDGNSVSGLFDFLIDRLACSCKHPSFKNEDEYRLIVTPPFMDYQHLKFKTRKSTLRPHIPVRIPRQVSGHENGQPLAVSQAVLAGRLDFIDRVIVGPTVSQELTVQAIQALMKTEKLNVEVRSSKVPYRDW